MTTVVPDDPPPSVLLAPLLEYLPDLFHTEVLRRLAQGPCLARGGGARVRGGGGGDRAHAVGQTREDESRVPPPTAVFEGGPFICRWWREPRGVGVALQHRLPAGCGDV